MRPSPTTPSVFSVSSTPSHLLRSQRPALSAAFAWGTLRYMLADRIAEKLPRLVMPVLVVRGEHDPIATQVWCERLVEMTKDGSLAVVPGAAHAINYTEPEAVAALIHEFATRVELDAQY